MDGQDARPWWRSIWGLVAFAVAFLVVAGGVKLARDPGLLGRLAPRPGVERKVDAMLVDGAAVAALKAHFPQDYAAFRADLIGHFRARKSEAGARELALSRMRAIVVRLTPDIARAPASDIGVINDAEFDLVRHLKRKDTKLCAAYATGSFEAGKSFDEDAIWLADLATAARLKAAVAGARSPVEWPAPTPADGRVLAEEMRRAGASDVMVAAILENGLESMDQQTQCETGLAFNSALVSMPEEASARLTSMLLREAAGRMAARGPAP